MPSWPVLSKIVAILGGDQDEFRDLWAAARDSRDMTDKLPAPAESGRADVSVFISYAQVDNKATYGRIADFVSSVKGLYESMTGDQVGLFMDTESIEPGDVWLDRIRLAISSSAVLLAFVSPAYLRSAYCNAEYREFASFMRASSRARLIIPLLFVSRERIGKYFEEDKIWAEIQTLQPLVLDNLRFEKPGSSEWLRQAQLVADRIEDALSEVAMHGELPEGSSSNEMLSVAADTGYFLEVVARAEDTANATQEHLLKITSLLENLGHQANIAVPPMSRATTAKGKLAVARQFARAITPISAELAAGAQGARSGMGDWDRAVMAIIARVKSDSSQIDDPRVQEFLQTISNMAKIGIDSLDALVKFSDSIASAKGFAQELDVPFRVIEDAIRDLSAIRGTFTGWTEALAILAV
ncbi:MAG: toll/interleukin-1 receptor domain-containing protein [Pseudonocardiaceae bacterium]